MSSNLFVSYDLHEPGKNYEAVAAAIKQLSGVWAKVHYSLWYVRSNMFASQAAERIWRSMDASDSLIVIDVTNNDAYWYNLTPDVSKHLQQNWRAQLAA